MPRRKRKLDRSFDNLHEFIPKHFDPEQAGHFVTMFYQRLSLAIHLCCHKKMGMCPTVPFHGPNDASIYYTPGISEASKYINQDVAHSWTASNRANKVGIITDSSRVLGLGDLAPPAGMSVMMGKAWLMWYLAGIDATPICINNLVVGPSGKQVHDPYKMVDFVRMIAPTFGAINLEDISQPNCFTVLEELRYNLGIPVWHDDQQGTAAVVLAGLINALKLVNKKMSGVKMVFYGAGASNTAATRLITRYPDGGNYANMIVMDSWGPLHRDRPEMRTWEAGVEERPVDDRVKARYGKFREFDARASFERRFWQHKFNLCENTNPEKITTHEEAFRGADVLIALSAPGPHTISPDLIKLMAPNAIVFACANPIPEIYPEIAKQAGAAVVVTGRGDFPNQVNNSLVFPGLLAGSIAMHAKKISDMMAISSAQAISRFAEDKLTAQYIIPTMFEEKLHANVAKAAAQQAINEGLAQRMASPDDVYAELLNKVQHGKKLYKIHMETGLIKDMAPEMINRALQETLTTTKKLYPKRRKRTVKK